MNTVNQNETNNEIVQTLKLIAGNKRTYYFDIRKSRTEDNFYLTISESVKRNDGRGFDKHKIIVFKEDLTRFADLINASVEKFKTDLMPDYDFEKFSNKQKEWEEANKKEDDINW